MNFKFKVTGKLVALFLGFGLIPAVLVFIVFESSKSSFEAAFREPVRLSAVSLGDTIDRNLFERYGDVQAFGLNAAASDRANWDNASDRNPLVRAMNGYMTGYGIYRLMLLLDTEGRVVAANSVDPLGNPLDTSALYGRDFGGETWFQSAIEGRFLEGHNGMSGTVVEQPHPVAAVSELYGDDGYVIPFAAPVTDAAGQTAAVWVNFADFGLVEEIFKVYYHGLADQGMANAELTLLDPEGRIIVDYDPLGQGWSEYRRNFDVVGKLNLAEKGVEAAVAAVEGEAGAIVSRHARKGIDQAAGFAHSKGAYDYPGLGWSALVTTMTYQATAVARSDATLVAVDGAKLRRVMQRDNRLGFQIM